MKTITKVIAKEREKLTNRGGGCRPPRTIKRVLTSNTITSLYILGSIYGGEPRGDNRQSWSETYLAVNIGIRLSRR